MTAREIGRMHHDIAGTTLVIFEDLGDMPQEQIPFAWRDGEAFSRNAGM